MLAGLLLAAFAQHRSAAPAATQPRYDVVLFVVDDVASADLALFGGVVPCPNLEALALQGVSFSNAYANPLCSPTRRSLMTGHWWVTGNGAGCPGASVSPNTPLPAEVFLPEALPFHVAGIAGKWHLGTAPSGGPYQLAPIEHGFECASAMMVGNVASCGGLDYDSWRRFDALGLSFSSGPSTAYQPSAVRASFNGGWPAFPSPKLAVVCSNLAHEPFHAPPPQMLPPGFVVGPTARDRFEAMIRAWDHQLGQMLARVDLSRTLVVVVGDNGTTQNAAPVLNRAKGTTFERGVRVPLVIAGGPTLAAGLVSDELVHVVDVWATAVDAGGGSPPRGSPWPLVGVSLVPTLTGVAHPPPHEFVLVGDSWGVPRGDVASVRSDGTKLRLLDYDGDEQPDRREFYDMAIDPGESTNRIADLAYASRIAEHEAFVAASLP